MTKILVAEDDKNFKRLLVNALLDQEYRVAETDSGVRALEMLEQDDYDVLLLDLNLPRLSGMDVLRSMKASGISTEVVILTGNAAVDTAVEAMKLGAYDFLTKPFKMKELAVVVEKAYEKKRLLAENLLLKTQIKRQSASTAIVTASPLMQDTVKTATRFAASNFPVLIYGESGVGKELIARAIHDASSRADGPFIPVNCGAIPDNMIESELFGHEMGAFTGAHARKPGLLEIANNGTLFLDEIGELPLPLQVKLLRVLETGTFFRLGGTREIKVDVKFVAATNKYLKQEMERDKFRSDLFYRISALTIHIPPLRERREDIPLLVEHFIKHTPAFRNKTFNDEALRRLSGYSWPGNVRELQNVVHRVLLLSQHDTIGPSDLPVDLDAQHKVVCYRLEDVEREHIMQVLKETGGQKGKAAELLGISPKTLYNKLMSYGIAE
jgi:DNA-binding NtrC family response regulator